MMNHLIIDLMVAIADTTNEDDTNFLIDVKSMLSISKLCSALGINRNRYNYLKRTKQLDSKILELREE